MRAGALPWPCCLIAACSSNPPPAAAPATPPAPPPLSAQDSSFINMAAAGGMAEVQEGQLAAKQAARPAVRAFGQKMVDDHTPVNQQLMSLASSKGATPPSQLSDADQAMLTKLQGMHGRAFDMAYARGQVTDHEKMLQLLKQESTDGTDPDLKSFAQQTIPTIQQHLTMAQDLAGMRRHSAAKPATAKTMTPAKATTPAKSTAAPASKAPAAK